MKSLLCAVFAFWPRSILTTNQAFYCEMTVKWHFGFGFGYLSFFSPLSWNRCSTLLLASPPVLYGSVPVTSLKLHALCWSHAHLLHYALFNNLPVWPAGTRQRGASPLGSAALAVRSKECSRAQPWREPCCHPMGLWRERMIWWGWSKSILILDDLKCLL